MQLIPQAVSKIKWAPLLRVPLKKRIEIISVGLYVWFILFGQLTSIYLLYKLLVSDEIHRSCLSSAVYSILEISGILSFLLLIHSLVKISICKQLALHIYYLSIMIVIVDIMVDAAMGK